MTYILKTSITQQVPVIQRFKTRQGKFRSLPTEVFSTTRTNEDGAARKIERLMTYYLELLLEPRKENVPWNGPRIILLTKVVMLPGWLPDNGERCVRFPLGTTCSLLHAKRVSKVTLHSVLDCENVHLFALYTDLQINTHTVEFDLRRSGFRQPDILRALPL